MSDLLPTLPPELICYIVDTLAATLPPTSPSGEATSPLLALSLVGRTWAAAAKPALWRRILFMSSTSMKRCASSPDLALYSSEKVVIRHYSGDDASFAQAAERLLKAGLKVTGHLCISVLGSLDVDAGIFEQSSLKDLVDLELYTNLRWGRHRPLRPSFSLRQLSWHGRGSSMGAFTSLVTASRGSLTALALLHASNSDDLVLAEYIACLSLVLPTLRHLVLDDFVGARVVSSAFSVPCQLETLEVDSVDGWSALQDSFLETSTYQTLRCQLKGFREAQLTAFAHNGSGAEQIRRLEVPARMMSRIGTSIEWGQLQASGELTQLGTFVPFSDRHPEFTHLRMK